MNEFSEWMNEFSERYRNQAERFKMQKNKGNEIFMQDGHRMICVPIYVHKEYLAYLILDTGQLEIEETDLMMIEQAGSVVAIELLKERELLQREQAMKEQLLEDILLRRYKDEGMILQRENYLGYDISRQYSIFVLDANGFENYLCGPLKNSSESRIQNINADIHEIIRNKIETEFPQVLFCFDSIGATGMVKIKNEKEIRRCQKVLEAVIAELEKEYAPLTFLAGLGSVRTKVSQASESLEEARLAMKTGKSLADGFGTGKACLHATTITERRRTGCLSTRTR